MTEPEIVRNGGITAVSRLRPRDGHRALSGERERPRFPAPRRPRPPRGHRRRRRRRRLRRVGNRRRRRRRPSSSCSCSHAGSRGHASKARPHPIHCYGYNNVERRRWRKLLRSDVENSWQSGVIKDSLGHSTLLPGAITAVDGHALLLLSWAAAGWMEDAPVLQAL